MSGRIKSLRGNGTKRTKRTNRSKSQKPCPSRQMELARRRRKQKNSTLWQLQLANKIMARQEEMAASAEAAAPVAQE